MAAVGAAVAAGLKGDAAVAGRYFCFQQFPSLVFDEERFIAWRKPARTDRIEVSACGGGGLLQLCCIVLLQEPCRCTTGQVDTATGLIPVALTLPQGMAFPTFQKMSVFCLFSWGSKYLPSSVGCTRGWKPTQEAQVTLVLF